MKALSTTPVCCPKTIIIRKLVSVAIFYYTFSLKKNQNQLFFHNNYYISKNASMYKVNLFETEFCCSALLFYNVDLTTWGKSWDKTKRQNSSDMLPTYKSGKLALDSGSEDDSTNGSKPKISDEDVKKVYEMYKNAGSGTDLQVGASRNPRTRRNIKCMSDHLELNQTQLADYLKLMDADSQKLDKIFDADKSEGEESEGKKKSRRSKLKSMFMIR